MCKTIKHTFSIFYPLIKHGFLTNQSAQGPFYILMLNNSTEAMLVFHMYSNLYLLVGYTQEDGVIVWCVILFSVGITPLYIS